MALSVLQSDITADTEPTDPDLYAHFVTAKMRGVTLFGVAVDEAIGALEYRDYARSLEHDVDWMLNQQQLLDDPVYALLNLCRTILVNARVQS